MPVLVAIWEAIIAGVPWIVGYFTVEKVVSHLGASTDDKKKLLEAVSKQCKELNLSPEQCQALMSQTQADANSSPLADVIKWGIGGWLLMQGISMFGKSK